MTAVQTHRGSWAATRPLLAVIAIAWAVAIVAEVTGRAEAVHHHQLVGGSLGLWASLALFLVAWQLHVAAMMLPSSLPLIGMFTRASATQPHPLRARSAFLGGYALVWTGFGLAALGGDAVLHVLVDRWRWLAHNPQLIGGSVLIVAGLFQFSTLKDRCMRVCRHPAMFLMTHYQRGSRAALSLGVRHGVVCLGCCWALMLVMFAVGISNLAWMAPLALVMVYEKVGAHGDRIAVPVGTVLILLGVLVLGELAWMPDLMMSHDH